MMDGKTVRQGRGTASGFTLVEMVIVIGVIILLAALTLSVSVAVVEGSEVRQTENTIRLLTTALQEWEASADRKISYGLNNEPYNQGEQYEIQQPVYSGDLDSFLDESHDATKWLFSIISRPTSVKQILAQVDPEVVAQTVVGDQGFEVDTFEFSDAWGHPIIAVFPGRTWADNFDDPDYRDSDGTIRAPIEWVCGVTANRQICFVSGGPDGSYGDLTAPPDTDDYKQAEDNLYSYDPPETSSQ
ncbi:MAG: type II secretion system protein [Planctomycetota bacterium]|jgi:type II secretory pathway pseudopilin PulG